MYKVNNGNEDFDSRYKFVIYIFYYILYVFLKFY